MHEMEAKQTELIERPIDVKTVRVNGKLVHIPGADVSSVDHWAFKTPDGKNIGYYSDNTVHMSDTVHAKWYHVLKFGHASVTFDSNKMQHALSVVIPRWNGSKYNAFTHNCHNFVDAAVGEYRKEGGQLHWHRSLF